MSKVKETDVMAALRAVMDPELHRSIVELNMVRDLVISDGTVRFTIALTIPECPLRDQISADARQAVSKLPGVTDVVVTLGAMNDEERAAALGHGAEPAGPTSAPFNHVKHVIAIASGKGGVGKSSVTALLGVALARAGLKVGILDADVTGPSIPLLFGLSGAPRVSMLGLLPPQTALGIKVMSVNLLLSNENDPVIWRGPVISQVIQQFWNEVVWGNLDYLLVDLPPGTADAPLTVMQSLPLDGLVLVTTPQELAAMVVRKAQSMAKTMNVPVLGLIENMGSFLCPTCGTRHELFGPSHVDEIGDAVVLARLPILPEVARLGDAGSIEQVSLPELDAAAAALVRLAPVTAAS